MNGFLLELSCAWMVTYQWLSVFCLKEVWSVQLLLRTGVDYIKEKNHLYEWVLHRWVCVMLSFVSWHFTLLVCQITARVRWCKVLSFRFICYSAVRDFSLMVGLSRVGTCVRFKNEWKNGPKKLCHPIWIALENVRNVRRYQFQSSFKLYQEQFHWHFIFSF